MLRNVKLVTSLCQLSKCFISREIVSAQNKSACGSAVLPIRNICPKFEELHFGDVKVTDDWKALESRNAVTRSVLQFSPNLTQNRSVLPMLDMPNANLQNVFQLPPCSVIDTLDGIPGKDISAPPTENVIEKIAARLIVIRRRKMKKHKLRKLRKKMKFEWAKVRQRRELKKEKKFQAHLIKKIKTAESFDAKRFVAEKLARVHAAMQTNKA